MPTPKLCRHKGRSLGYVTLTGREHYLGSWPEGDWKPPPAVRAAFDTESAGGTVGTVGEFEGVKFAAAILKELFGRLPAAEFGPKALKQVRAAMVARGWSWSYVHKQTNRLKRMFRRAAEEELVPAEVAARVWAVRAVRRGEPGDPETDPVRPAPEDHVAAALPHLSPQVRAMVELQRATGMRPGEVCAMRTRDIDRDRDVWVYRPASHKTAHRGHAREVFLGPKARAALEPWLRADPDAYLFSPAEAERARNAGRTAARRTPNYPSHLRRNADKRRAAKRRPRRDK